jgi:hypothetical protein
LKVKVCVNVWRFPVLTKRKQHLKASVLFVLSPATEKTNSRYSCIVDKAIFPYISLRIHHIEKVPNKKAHLHEIYILCQKLLDGE